MQRDVKMQVALEMLLKTKDRENAQGIDLDNLLKTSRLDCFSGLLFPPIAILKKTKVLAGEKASCLAFCQPLPGAGRAPFSAAKLPIFTFWRPADLAASLQRVVAEWGQARE